MATERQIKALYNRASEQEKKILDKWKETRLVWEFLLKNEITIDEIKQELALTILKMEGTQHKVYARTEETPFRQNTKFDGDNQPIRKG